MTDQQVEEVNLHLTKLDKGFKEVSKQFVSIQRSLNAIYEDRDLLTDINLEILKVRELVLTSDKRNEKLTQNVTNTLEKKTDQIVAEVSVTSDEIKNSIVDRLIYRMRKTFKKDNIKIKTIPWYRRLFFWIVPGTISPYESR